MEKHKDKALEDRCLCSKCPHKFECFTQERIFSDPIFQGLFEALMAEGYTREGALAAVEAELKARIGRVPSCGEPESPDYIYWDTNTTCDSRFYYPITYTNVDTADSNVYITYTMADGKEVSWSCTID